MTEGAILAPIAGMAGPLVAYAQIPAPGWDLLTGSVSGLVIALLALYFVVRAQVVVPGPMFAQSEKRNATLEAEAIEQDGLLKTQAEALTEQMVANARLEEEVKHLTAEVSRLTEEVSKLTGVIERLQGGAA